jgi:hypothetical protein
LEGKGVEANYLTVMTHTDVYIHVTQRTIGAISDDEDVLTSDSAKELTLCPPPW